jgi:hypothetical protein
MDLKFPSDKLLQKALIEVLVENPSGLGSKEIDVEVARKLTIDPSLLAIVHSGTRTEFAYRLAWARTKAKKRKLISRDESSKKWSAAEVQK